VLDFDDSEYDGDLKRINDGNSAGDNDEEHQLRDDEDDEDDDEDDDEIDMKTRPLMSSVSSLQRN